MTAILRLSLTDFRNHRDAVIGADEGFVLLSGPNGAGKTNVLEAVSLLTPGRGLGRSRSRKWHEATDRAALQWRHG